MIKRFGPSRYSYSRLRNKCRLHQKLHNYTTRIRYSWLFIYLTTTIIPEWFVVKRNLVGMYKKSLKNVKVYFDFTAGSDHDLFSNLIKTRVLNYLLDTFVVKFCVTCRPALL